MILRSSIIIRTYISTFVDRYIYYIFLSVSPCPWKSLTDNSRRTINTMTPTKDITIARRSHNFHSFVSCHTISLRWPFGEQSREQFVLRFWRVFFLSCICESFVPGLLRRLQNVGKYDRQRGCQRRQIKAESVGCVCVNNCVPYMAYYFNMPSAICFVWSIRTESKSKYKSFTLS